MPLAALLRSAMPGYNTPCTHLVIDGMRYLYFLKEKVSSHALAAALDARIAHWH